MTFFRTLLSGRLQSYYGCYNYTCSKLPPVHRHSTMDDSVSASIKTPLPIDCRTTLYPGELVKEGFFGESLRVWDCRRRQPIKPGFSGGVRETQPKSRVCVFSPPGYQYRRSLRCYRAAPFPPTAGREPGSYLNHSCSILRGPTWYCAHHAWNG